jgi:hypothetical protein
MHGTEMRARLAPVRLQLRGPMPELRWLGRARAPVAEPGHVARLRKKAQGMENDLDPQELLRREGWMGALFSLDGHDAESVATHETLT